MKEQDYLDHNLRELFKSVEPQLHIRSNSVSLRFQFPKHRLDLLIHNALAEL